MNTTSQSDNGNELRPKWLAMPLLFLWVLAFATPVWSAEPYIPPHLLTREQYCQQQEFRYSPACLQPGDTSFFAPGGISGGIDDLATHAGGDGGDGGGGGDGGDGGGGGGGGGSI